MSERASKKARSMWSIVLFGTTDDDVFIFIFISIFLEFLKLQNYIGSIIACSSCPSLDYAHSADNAYHFFMPNRRKRVT